MGEVGIKWAGNCRSLGRASLIKGVQIVELDRDIGGDACSLGSGRLRVAATGQRAAVDSEA